ncbi:hypothetical protein CIB95_09710 [Lottiidibacillus patelloidae]|uniref:D-glucuronyl C5-epimerase C-terminal domain-containing protein n=1 Tax=Lottiidibacillus patelloidae TaxID=2670334 RepID=A0A263BV45_9BACI|nr:hypothetical protein [Lottiidibacillus patelloidae]OZM57036.1 hypothetical protein CIB95_09710 [Lottiidibacillus patelloidae]
MQRKKFFLLILLMVTAIGFGLSYFLVNDDSKSDYQNTSEIVLNETYNISASVNNYELELENIETKNMYGVKDTTYDLILKNNSGENVGLAYVTLREVPNDDMFVYVHLNAKENIQITLLNKLKSNSYQLKELNRSTAEVYPHRKKNKVDPTTNIFTYINFIKEGKSQGSIFIGGQYLFNKLEHTYPESNKTSTVYELISERRDIQISQDEDVTEVAITTTANNSLGESWYLISKDQLFTSDDEFELAQKIGIDEYKWLTPTEVITKSVSSIFPFSDMGYVRSLVRQSAKKSIIANEETKARFFEDINWNSFVQLELIRENDGLWYSNYTSTWLEGKYGIPTYYVDTRHNDNIFREQMRRANVLGIDEYNENYKIYADFLIEKLEEGQTINTENGMFLVDYFSDYGHSMTHTSLNHGLSLMNYFYYSYQKSGDEKYLEAGDKLLNALIDTGDRWIDEKDGSLFYQINQDKSFQSKDYKLVTYYDLLYTRKLLLEIKGSSVPIVEKLIDVKVKYLKKHDLNTEINMAKIEDYVGIIE